MIKNTNDGSDRNPYLRVDMNYMGVNRLPEYSKGPKGSDREKHKAIQEAGFKGIQDGDISLCRELGLKATSHARINKVGELGHVLPQWKDEGRECASIHLGWGMESDSEVNKLVEYVLNESEKADFPIYIETHRSTITQDMQRTVSLVNRFPEIRFNGDFSHWYTGQEMVYGGIENKWEFIAPVFERVRFMHGRIGNPGCIQVNIKEGGNQEYTAHFKEMWKRSFKGFLKSATQGDFLIFAVELLPADIYYARSFENEEEGDRWQQALLYKDIVNNLWAEVSKEIDS